MPNNAALFVQMLEAVAWVLVSAALLGGVVYLACVVVGFLISGDEDV
jgi:hypothetical protein